MELRKRQAWLDAARATAIFSITLNHAVNRAYNDTTLSLLNAQAGCSAELLFRNVLYVFSRIGVPLFLMISGALLLNKPMENGTDVRRFYKHNLGRLFLTSEIWLLLMYFFSVLTQADSVRQRGVWYILTRLFGTLLFVNQLTLSSMWYIPVILCIYTMIPLFCVAVKRIPGKYIAIPAAVVVTGGILMPNANLLLSAVGSAQALDFAVNHAEVFSVYVLYVLIGYYIGRGVLSRIATVWVAGGCAFSFCGTCAFLYVYPKPENTVQIYSLLGVFLTACLAFELFRRADNKPQKKESKPVCYVSKASFGIYFVHIIIIESMNRYIDWSAVYRPVKLLLLEAGAFGGSLLLIFLLSKIPLCKKYLFMMKD